MKPKLIKKIEEEQFKLEQNVMQAGLVALKIPEKNRVEILRYFGWLCFDRILRKQFNSENLQKQEKIHHKLYQEALEEALKIAKPNIKNWNEAGLKMLKVYSQSIQR